MLFKGSPQIKKKTVKIGDIVPFGQPPPPPLSLPFPLPESGEAASLCLRPLLILQKDKLLTQRPLTERMSLETLMEVG